MTIGPLRGGRSGALLYITDFDSASTGPGTRASATDFDPLPGGALPREGTTAPGDSGSGLLFLNGAFGTLHLGALGVGTNVPGGLPSGFGDISWFNPGAIFHQFIVENNPLVNAGVRAGDGQWTDAARWVQLLNPEYYVLSGGQLVNRAPGGNEGGVTQTAGAFGPTNDWQNTGNRQAPANAPAAGLDTIYGGTRITEPNPDVTAIQFTPGAAGIGGNTQVFRGPGSSGFVPNNTDGTPGTAFANAARYFDVYLGAQGTTTLSGANIVIDRVTLTGRGSRLVVAGDATLRTELSSRQRNGGVLAVNGTFTTHNYFLQGGLLQGTGTLRTAAGAAVINAGGSVAPGGVNTIGAFRIDGSFLQSTNGVLEIEVGAPPAGARPPVNADVLNVSGVAALGGTLVVGALLNPQGQRGPVDDEFTGLVINAQSVAGAFASVTNALGGLLFPRITYTNAGVQLSIGRQGIVAGIEGAAPAPVIVDQRTGNQPATPVALGEPGVNAPNLTAPTTAPNPNATNSGASLNLEDRTAVTPGTDPRTGRSLAVNRPPVDLSPEAEAFANALDAARADEDVDALLELLFDWIDITDMASILESLADDVVEDAMGGGDIDFTAADTIDSQIGDRLAQVRGDSPRSLLAHNRRVRVAAADGVVSDAANPLLPAAKDSGVFVAIDGVGGRAEPNPGATKSKFEIYSFTAGADHRFRPDLVAGVALSFGAGEAKGAPGSTTESQSVGATLYAGYADGPVYVDASAGLGFGTYDFENTITFPAPGRVTGSTDGLSFRASLRGGYVLSDDGTTRFGAYARLKHRTVTIDGYQETGAGVLTLAFGDRTMRETAGGLGLEVSHVFRDSTGVANVAVMAEAAWMHALSQDGFAVDARFAEIPAAGFRTALTPPGRDWAEVAAGVAFAAGEDTTITVRGEADLGRARYESYGGSLTVRIAF